jgi:uncharacterized protein (TIGR02118 family)
MVKYVSLIHRPPGTRRKDVIDYWLNVHAPLIRSLLPEMQKYVINLVVKEDDDDTQYDGVVELHFRDMASLRRSLDGPGWQSEQRMASSVKVLDYSRSKSFVVEENVVALNP